MITTATPTGNTTTTTFPLGTGDGQTNASGSGHIAYCWAEIPGYSKFSFYQGTGQADGEGRAVKAAEMAINNPLIDCEMPF